MSSYDVTQELETKLIQMEPDSSESESFVSTFDELSSLNETVSVLRDLADSMHKPAQIIRKLSSDDRRHLAQLETLSRIGLRYFKHNTLTGNSNCNDDVIGSWCRESGNLVSAASSQFLNQKIL